MCQDGLRRRQLKACCLGPWLPSLSLRSGRCTPPEGCHPGSLAPPHPPARRCPGHPGGSGVRDSAGGVHHGGHPAGMHPSSRSLPFCVPGGQAGCARGVQWGTGQLCCHWRLQAGSGTVWASLITPASRKGWRGPASLGWPSLLLGGQAITRCRPARRRGCSLAQPVARLTSLHAS